MQKEKEMRGLTLYVLCVIINAQIIILIKIFLDHGKELAIVEGFSFGVFIVLKYDKGYYPLPWILPLICTNLGTISKKVFRESVDGSDELQSDFGGRVSWEELRGNWNEKMGKCLDWKNGWIRVIKCINIYVLLIVFSMAKCVVLMGCRDSWFRENMFPFMKF